MLQRGTGTARTAVAITAAAAAVLTGCTTKNSSPDRTKAPGNAARPSPTPTPAWNTRPASVAALGDSITRGFDACGLLKDCPQRSWVTALAATLPAPASNLARSGARMADLVRQAEQAVARRPEQVVILMGANDACRNTVAQMTPVDTYRRQFAAAMTVLGSRLPKTQVFVASVPDLERLRDVGRRIPLAKEIWKLGICPTMLAEPDSTAPSAVRRRAEVRSRVVEYNNALREVCGSYDRCRYDGGAVFTFRFTAGELSPFDWFHPSQRGQAQLARVIAQAGFSSGTVTRSGGKPRLSRHRSQR